MQAPTSQGTPERPGLGRWAMYVLWPAFLMAGVTEALVFAVVDPSDLSWFGQQPMDLSRQAIYTLSFLMFWGLISLAASLTLALATLPEAPEDAHPRGWPR